MIVVVGTPNFRPPVTSGDGSAGGLAAAIARAASAAGATVQLVGKIGDDPAGDAVMLSLARDRIGHAALLRDLAHPTPTAFASDDYEPAVDLDAPDGLAAAFDDDDDPSGPRHPRERILPADPALRPALEAADVELGLRYVADFSVLVLAEPLDADARRAAFEAAAYGQAHVIEIELAGSSSSAGSSSASGSTRQLATVVVLAADEAPPATPLTAFEAPDDDPEGTFAVLIGRYAAALDAGRDPRAAFAEASRSGGWEPAAN